MFFNFDLSNFANETYWGLICIIGNKIYKKKMDDKKYKLFLSFKNSTKAKKFMTGLIKNKGLSRFGRMRNVFISINPI
jgi:hypothetical protein